MLDGALEHLEAAGAAGAGISGKWEAQSRPEGRAQDRVVGGAFELADSVDLD
jgi:hypothetical protein